MPDVHVFCYPTNDFQFERRARFIARQRPDSTIEEVQCRLRLEYPRAVVVPRVRLADLFPLSDRLTWYAYRDGPRDRHN